MQSQHYIFGKKVNAHKDLEFKWQVLAELGVIGDLHEIVVTISFILTKSHYLNPKCIIVCTTFAKDYSIQR